MFGGESGRLKMVPRNVRRQDMRRRQTEKANMRPRLGDGGWGYRGRTARL
jgi:hypothetical protein